MALILPITDETTSGTRRSAGNFQFDAETLSLRELIRRRVEQEVERFNRADNPIFHGLIESGETERILNGTRERLLLDWETQYARAMTAFQGNGFLVIVDGRQVTDPDEEIELTAETNISFLKLVPLIGG